MKIILTAEITKRNSEKETSKKHFLDMCKGVF